jgi:hypothetical protein
MTLSDNSTLALEKTTAKTINVAATAQATAQKSPGRLAPTATQSMRAENASGTLR